MPEFYLPNMGHGDLILAPVDINGGITTTDVISLKDYTHVDILIMLGVTGAASTVTVEECDNVTPSTHTEIVFDYYACTTAGGDVLGAKTTATVAGFATSTNDGVWYVIPIDAAQLTEDYPYLRLSFSNPGVSTMCAVFAHMSGAAYGSDQSATVES